MVALKLTLMPSASHPRCLPLPPTGQTPRLERVPGTESVCRRERLGPFVQGSSVAAATPGDPRPAGYITVDDEAGRALFYTFVESARQPDTDPVVL